jgi:hypothetical protein
MSMTSIDGGRGYGRWWQILADSPSSSLFVFEHTPPTDSERTGRIQNATHLSAEKKTEHSACM